MCNVLVNFIETYIKSYLEFHEIYLNIRLMLLSLYVIKLTNITKTLCLHVCKKIRNSIQVSKNNQIVIEKEKMKNGSMYVDQRTKEKMFNILNMIYEKRKP